MSQLDDQEQSYPFKRNFILIALCSMLGGCLGFVEHHAHSTVYAYTDANVSIPEYKVSTDNKLSLEQKIKEFQANINRQESATLILTAQDLNILVIEQNPHLQGNTYLKIEENQIIMKKSFALEGFPGFSGRFLNTTTSLLVSLQNNYLVVTPNKILLREQEISEILMENYRLQNLAEDLMKNEIFKDLFQQVKSLEVKNNKVFIQY